MGRASRTLRRGSPAAPRRHSPLLRASPGCPLTARPVGVDRTALRGVVRDAESMQPIESGAARGPVKSAEERPAVFDRKFFRRIVKLDGLQPRGRLGVKAVADQPVRLRLR